jgi:hypothetical protein
MLAREIEKREREVRRLREEREFEMLRVRITLYYSDFVITAVLPR